MGTNQKTSFSIISMDVKDMKKQYRVYCTEDKLFESASASHMREVEVVAQSEKAQAQSPLSLRVTAPHSADGLVILR